VAVPESMRDSDSYALWIVSHYRLEHSAVLEEFQHNYLRGLMGRLGLWLP